MLQIRQFKLGLTISLVVVLLLITGRNAFAKDLASPILSSYLDLGAALANDDLPKSLQAYDKLKSEIVSSQGDLADKLKGALSDGAYENLESLREQFASLSEALTSTLATEELPENIVHVYCPMARQNKGASWLQEGKDIKNPYFGEAMLSCGEIKR